MDRSIPAALVLVLLSLVTPARAHLHLTADEPQVSLTWWTPDVRGALGAQSGTVAAGATYADEGTSSLGATLSLHTFGAVYLDLDYTPIHTDAPVIARADFRFRNQSFGVTGEAGRLRYDMPILGFGLRYLVLSGRHGNLGVIGTVKVVKPDVELTLSGRTAAFDLVLPVPLAGLSGQLNFCRWAHVFGSIKVLHLDVAAVDARIEDWEAGLVLDSNPARSPGFRAATGYRKLDIDIASGGDGDIRFTTRRGGPFLELAVIF